jgi:hypothetical protein
VDPNTDPSGGQTATLESLQAELAKIAKEKEELASSVLKLEAKRTEALTEAKKRKRVDQLLKTVGIDIEDEDAEDALVAKLSESANAASQSKSDTSGEPAATGTPAAGVSSTNPQDLELKSQLKLLQKKLFAMEEKAKESERREQEAIEKRKRDLVELKVKEALQRSGCIQPSHFYKLQSGSFRLSDDGETVIGGPEHDPRSLEDAIESFKDDQEFAMYFRGSGASGSGMSGKAGGGFGGQSLKNPFRTDQKNITEASRIIQADPEKAKRLALEARNAGKLDPRLGKVLGF